MKKFFVSVLCVFLVFSLAVNAFAVRAITSDEEKKQYTELFNNSVNEIKTSMPYAKHVYSAGVPDKGITVISEGETKDIDEMAQKYLLPVLDGLFNNSSSTAKSFINVLFGKQGDNGVVTELQRNIPRDDTVPVFGQKYVSDLTPAEDFDIISDESVPGKPSQIAVIFRDCDLKDSADSSLPKVFSLPSGNIDPTIIRGNNTYEENMLSGVKFNSFVFENAKLVAKYDSENKISYYATTITYNIKISTYDCMKLISAVLGYDFFQAGVNTANTILRNLNKKEVKAEDLLSQEYINVLYTVTNEVYDINFTPRYFGDIDDNGYVTVEDARTALRVAVKLEELKDNADRIYADVNFDGSVTVEDARFILRMAVKLDPLMTEVPEGSEIKIGKINYDYSDNKEEPEKENPDNSELEITEPEKDKTKGFLEDFKPSVKLDDIAQSVFDAIDTVEEFESGASSAVTSIADAIRGIVEAAKS